MTIFYNHIINRIDLYRLLYNTFYQLERNCCLIVSVNSYSEFINTQIRWKSVACCYY
ncbi:hypothetical protein IFVP22_C210393 [Vibrio parahaemolyticus]